MLDERDEKRLGAQLRKVIDALPLDTWITLEDLAKKAGVRNPSSVASRLRDLKAFHGYQYERRRTETEGLFEYKVIKPESLQLELIA